MKPENNYVLCWDEIREGLLGIFLFPFAPFLFVQTSELSSLLGDCGWGTRLTPPGMLLVNLIDYVSCYYVLILCYFISLSRLSTSTMSMSSGSSRGSLSASSRGSLSSLSLSDIYGMPQEDYGPPFNTLGDIICQGEPDNRRRTDLGMLEERHALRMTRLW